MYSSSPVEFHEEKNGTYVIFRQLTAKWDTPNCRIYDIFLNSAYLYQKKRSRRRLLRLLQALYEMVLFILDRTGHLAEWQEEWLDRMGIHRTVHPFASLYQYDVENDPHSADQLSLVLLYTSYHKVFPSQLLTFVRKKRVVAQ